ncbi:MAG: hypothetical protein Ta2B_07040 [Termitinemataceae bacterium]|nr:MAG: hypothetical protein Ta2B_07040 [Termitinemataceae bacterium]
MNRTILKKMAIVCLFTFFASILYAENRTGKVVAIESASAMGQIMKYIYIDSNGDNIIDVLLLVTGDSIKGMILIGYIKNGTSIVYNFDASKVKESIFVGDNESIVSIDGILVTKMFSNR